MPNLIYCWEEFYRISPKNSKMIECSATGTHPWKVCYNRRVVGDFYRLEGGDDVLFAWTSKGFCFSEYGGDNWQMVYPDTPFRMTQELQKLFKIERNNMSNKELLNNEELIEKITKEALPEVFYSIPWNISLLEKFKDKVDWKEVSSIISGIWSIQLLERFEEYLCWDILSSNPSPALLQEDIFDRFIDYWNWFNLTNNFQITWSIEMIDKYADYLDWKTLLDRLERLFFDYSIDPFKFYDRYKKYIPLDHLPKTELWVAMRKEVVKEEYSKIMQQINTL